MSSLRIALAKEIKQNTILLKVKMLCCRDSITKTTLEKLFVNRKLGLIKVTVSLSERISRKKVSFYFREEMTTMRNRFTLVKEVVRKTFRFNCTQ
jgi:hypothetical protein